MAGQGSRGRPSSIEAALWRQRNRCPEIIGNQRLHYKRLSAAQQVLLNAFSEGQGGCGAPDSLFRTVVDGNRTGWHRR